MAKRAFHLLQWLLVSLVAGGTLAAASDPFVGTWKLNPAKSRVTDRMQVDAAGTNKYAFTFGGGEAETIVLDGTEQPGNFGSTISVTAERPDTWKVVRKRDGKMVITGVWKLSEDGKTLTDSITTPKPDGSMKNATFVYKRATPGSGFVGVWESTSENMMTAGFEVQIEPYEGNGLSFVFPSQQRTRKITFDGKDHPDAGPNVLAGSTGAGRRVNERTVELTDKINGKVTDTQEITVSPDSKVLTMTIRQPGQMMMKPNVLVFEKSEGTK